jgi:PAS domain S-box-containing protein
METTSSTIRILVAGVLLMFAVFLVELNTGILAGTVAYVLIVLFILRFSRTEKLIITLAILSTVLIITGYFFTTTRVLTTQSIMLNRTLTLIGVWMASYFAIHYWRISTKEQKLKRQLGALFEYASEGIVFLDSTGKVMLSNPSVSTLFGYTPDELNGKSITMILPHNRNGSLDDILKAGMLGQNGLSSQEFTGVTRKGAELPIEICVSRYQAQDESAIIFFIQDISFKKERERLIQKSLEDTRQYNIELEQQVKLRTRELEAALDHVNLVNKSLRQEVDVRRKVEKELRKSQHLYAAMARNFPEGIIGVLNREMRYVFADGEELAAFGLDGQRITGQSIFGDNTELVPGYADELSKVYEGEKVKFDIEMGDEAYSVASVPLYTEIDEINEALVVIRNITPRKKVEKDLLKTIEKERELNLLKSRFVMTASHEFRTPLTTILSSATLLEMYKGEQYEGKKEIHIKRIKRAVNGLTELLNDFLSLGKLEEGKIRPVYSYVNIRSFCEEVLSQLEPVRKEGQKIQLLIEAEVEMIETDKQILKNIMLNLLSNAIKYSAPGAEIGWKLETSGGQLSMEIHDSGIGIPESEQDHIFKRFFRAKNAVDYEGTGLGLNITRKYVSLLQGCIRFVSKENGGTTFTLSVPIGRQELVGQESEAAPVS